MRTAIIDVVKIILIGLFVVWVFQILISGVSTPEIEYVQLEPCSFDNFTTGQTYVVSGNAMMLEEANSYSDGDVRLYFAPIAE